MEQPRFVAGDIVRVKSVHDDQLNYLIGKQAKITRITRNVFGFDSNYRVFVYLTFPEHPERRVNLHQSRVEPVRKYTFTVRRKET